MPRSSLPRNVVLIILIFIYIFFFAFLGRKYVQLTYNLFKYIFFLKMFPCDTARQSTAEYCHRVLNKYKNHSVLC